MNNKVKNLLLSMKFIAFSHNDIVFKNKQGGCFNTLRLSEVWAGKIENGKHYVTPLRKLIEEGKVRQYLKPYSMRATFITNQIKAGIPYTTVASWCGNSPETILKYYESPDIDIKPV